MDFTTIPNPLSYPHPDHFKAIMNASPSIGGATTFFRAKNIVMRKIPGFEYSGHNKVGVSEDLPTLFGQHD